MFYEIYLGLLYIFIKYKLKVNYLNYNQMFFSLRFHNKEIL